MIDRRSLLLFLVGTPSLLIIGAASLPIIKVRQDAAFLAISRFLVGSPSLSAGVAARIENLLRQRIERFDEKLVELEMALAGESSRDDAIGKLNDNEVTFALELVRPWYLGYLGTPSLGVLEDDAAFATYMEAQSYAKVRAFVPLRTYPPGAAGWWRAPPEGVDASDLPVGAADWEHQPREHYSIRAPDPSWLAYAEGKFSTIEDARAAVGIHKSSRRAGP